MPDSFALPNDCVLRPAVIGDRWQIQRLLRDFNQETVPRLVAPFAMLGYSILGLLVAFAVHLLLVVGIQALPYLLALLGLSLIVVFSSLLDSSEWTKFWVVEHQGELIACAKLYQHHHYSALFDVLVVSKWRSRGLGSCMVRHLARNATRPLYLACYPNRVSFYTRLGFAQIRPQDLSPILQHELGLLSQTGTVPLVLKQ
jgi:N-acetylglutamate synthase-like GNAT family acetyltransferase